MTGAGNRAGFESEFDQRPDIQDHWILPPVDFGLQFLGSNTGRMEGPQEVPALDKFPGQVGRQTADDQEQKGGAKAEGIIEKMFDLVMEHVA